MTKPIIFLLTALLLVFFSPAPASAATLVTKEEMRAGLCGKMRDSYRQLSVTTDKKTEKRLKRLTKRLDRKAERYGAQVDFNDPVDRWLWFGIFGLGIAVVLSFFASGGLAGLIALLALACLVVWIVKRSGA